MKRNKIYKLKIHQADGKGKVNLYRALGLLIRLEDLYEKEEVEDNLTGNIENNNTVC